MQSSTILKDKNKWFCLASGGVKPTLTKNGRRLVLVIATLLLVEIRHNN